MIFLRRPLLFYYILNYIPVPALHSRSLLLAILHQYLRRPVHVHFLVVNYQYLLVGALSGLQLGRATVLGQAESGGEAAARGGESGGRQSLGEEEAGGPVAAAPHGRVPAIIIHNCR